jgi:3',5'-cyclic AMP phosphodiesterase CpdA
MLVLAHVSDVHIDGSEDRDRRLRAVMGYLASLQRPVDVVVVTGDIADHGLVAEYEQASELLAGPAPVLTTPGNHDDRAVFRQVMLRDGAAGDGPVNQAAEVGGAVFLMCDSTIPGKNEGFLDDGTLAWMEAELERRGGSQPVFVCFHHPPVLLHAPVLDRMRQTGEHRLAALIGRHPEVVAVLCGHAHTAAAATFAGKPLRVAPGVLSTLLLPWESDELVSYALPPAFAFHVLDDDWQLTTHYRTVSCP